jgi:ABC-type lipoprotein export system ATPase subunit
MPYLTAQENVELPMTIEAWPREKRVGPRVAESWDRGPAGFTGPAIRRQRMAIAVALATGPGACGRRPAR